MSCLCRDCCWSGTPASRCPACGGHRLLAHAELESLCFAHLDCDAFYAAIEKRDNPDLIDRPVLVGGEKRGVVATCCYIARMHGVRSAMPMFEARRRCPDAVVIRPDFARYSAAGREVRACMRAVTPEIEPVSIDEAYMDLNGITFPARALARLALEIEARVGITVSIGLSHNRFLAKLASDRDKPRGFALIGRAETLSVLAPMKVGRIPGVGAAMERRLREAGFDTIGRLQRAGEAELVDRFGKSGQWLARRARGEDRDEVRPTRDSKSVSAETTFFEDLADFDALAERLEKLAARVAERLARQQLAGVTVTLKLKTPDFRLRTRALSLADPTGRADTIAEAGRRLLAAEADGTSFRLIGIGVSHLVPATEADPPDFFEDQSP